MFGVGANIPFARSLPTIKRRFAALRTGCDPAAATVCLLLVRWIADDHRDRLLLLDSVSIAARLSDGLVDLTKRLLLDERVAECIGDKESEIGSRRCGRLRRRHQCLHFCDNAKLRHGERPELKFGADYAFRCGLDGTAYCARALIV